MILLITISVRARILQLSREDIIKSQGKLLLQEPLRTIVPRTMLLIFLEEIQMMSSLHQQLDRA